MRGIAESGEMREVNAENGTAFVEMSAFNGRIEPDEPPI